MAKVTWNTPETELVMKYLVGSIDKNDIAQIARGHLSEARLSLATYEGEIGPYLTRRVVETASMHLGDWLHTWVEEMRYHPPDFTEELILKGLSRADWPQMAEGFIRKVMDSD